jgi:cephalosporin-C deacetylase-like acetyl esterase
MLFPIATAIYAEDNTHAFDYDAKAPLDIQEAGVEHRGNVAVHDITYASPKGGRVPAYLVVPDGKGRFAAVLWGHWYWAKLRVLQ